MANKIRWSRSDYISLGKAVASFNKAVGRITDTGIIVPEMQSYSELKSSISTRQELNRVINSMKRFTNPMEQQGVRLESGLVITKWEQSEINKAQRRATRRMTGELAGIEATSTYGTGVSSANEIKSTLEMFDRIFKSTSSDQFRRRTSVLYNQGRTDYDMKKARIFQENFITAYEKMGRTAVVELAKSYKNPMEFWEFIKDSGLVDIQMRYDIEKGIVSTGSTPDESFMFELMNL